jgi:hypothetical protein
VPASSAANWSVMLCVVAPPQAAYLKDATACVFAQSCAYPRGLDGLFRPEPR